ncbi:MAG: 50S ribosomal protein L9 [Deltaproteobacteria bacterium]|nr:50S ribosomal protein L9 [Deltaproteobacteria bacterium]
MRVILQEDVEKLGKSGDQVTVSDGYARNFLIPRNLAVRATTRNLKQLEHVKRVAAQRKARKLKLSADLRTKLVDLSITVTKPVGENEKLYGSVTGRDVEQALKDEGLTVDKKRIRFEESSIRSLGVYTVHVKLADGQEMPVKLWVVAK